MLEEGVKGNRTVCSSVLEQIDVKKTEKGKKRIKYNGGKEASAHILDIEKNDFADEWGNLFQFYINQKNMSKMQNWFISYHISEIPPIIHLLHQEVELRGRDVIFTAFDAFFNQIYATTNSKNSNNMDKSECDDILPTPHRPIEIKEQVARQVLANAVRQSSIKLEMSVPDESHLKGWAGLDLGKNKTSVCGVLSTCARYSVLPMKKGKWSA